MSAEQEARELVRKRQKARNEIEKFLIDYQDEHDLSDTEMVSVLAACQPTFLAGVVRDEDERRTGYRRRLAGE